MTRTLFLHIGSHKTGSTSIQRFLADRRTELTKQGIFYPTTGRKALNLNAAVNAKADLQDTENLSHRRAARLANLIMEQDADRVIASSEGFSYLSDRDAIQACQDALAPSFSTIRIISYLRRQDQFAVSHHQEGANPNMKPAARLHGHEPTALPPKSALQHQYLDYETRIGLWADVFGDTAMTLRVYDRATLKHADSIADFLDIVGLQHFDTTTALDQNISMGMVETKLGHMLHDIVTDTSIRASVHRHLLPSDRMLPARDDARAFLAPYVAGNRRLNQRFGINDTPNLFSDDFSMFPEQSNERWTEDTANTAIRACAEVIEELSAQSNSFSAAELTAAARALGHSRPDLAEKFRIAAHVLKPRVDRINGGLEKSVPDTHTAPATATADQTAPSRRAKRRAARQQKPDATA